MRHIFRYIIQMGFLAHLLLFPLGCTFIDPFQVHDNDYSAREPFEYKIILDGQTRFYIIGINGSITITGTANDTTLLVSGERIVRSESISDAEARLVDLKVETTSTEDEIVIQTEQPSETHGRTYEVTYNIKVPYQFAIEAYNANGVISIDSTQNDITAILTNGNIIVDHHNGKASLHLTNGNVIVKSQSQYIDTGITNGNIEADIQLADSGTCIMGTVNGEIALSIPQNTSAAFSASVANGQIWISDLTLQNPNITQNLMTGTLGDGSGTITLATVNGSIHVDGY